MNTASLYDLLNTARRTGWAHEDRGAARLSCQQAAALFSEASGGATLHSSGTPRSP